MVTRETMSQDTKVISNVQVMGRVGLVITTVEMNIRKGTNALWDNTSVRTALALTPLNYMLLHAIFCND